MTSTHDIELCVRVRGKIVRGALGQEGMVNRLRANTEQVKSWGGRILAAVGVWLIVLAIWADFFVRFLPV